MERMRRLLISYFNVRAAILRAVEDNHFSKVQLTCELNLSNESIDRRRKKPDQWRAAELGHLAKVLHISAEPERHLQEINSCLQAMEPSHLQWLRKGTLISRTRFQNLLKNSNSWRYSELIQLQNALQLYQPGLFQNNQAQTNS